MTQSTQNVSRVQSSILFADPDGWRLGAPAGAGPSDIDNVIAPPDAAPDALAAALRSAGYAGRPVVLALPSDACLCAPVATADLPARHRGQAMLYRLEERLPVSAEDVVAGFIPAGPASALGVCVRRQPFQSLLATLRAAGVNVRAACPRALLALQISLDERAKTATNAGQPAGDAGGPEMILWADGPNVEAIMIGADGTPRSWSVTPHDADDVALLVGMQSLVGGMSPASQLRRILAFGLAPAVLARVRQAFVSGECVESPAISTRALATTAAKAVLARRLLPWVDLMQAADAAGSASRRALAQARGPLSWLAASAAILAVSLLVALFWRAARYDRLATTYEARQRDVFRRAFPGQSVPRDVRSRLASEEQRLRGSAGTPRAAPADALLVLRDVIAGLPAGVRLTVSELRLDAAGGRFTLLGETRTRGDAQAIADALRGGFEVEPPRTEFRPGANAVGFTITGGVANRPAAAGAAGAVSSTADVEAERER